MKKNILYISLTGMTEPLGRSQVLEYLFDLSKENKFYLISFEREEDKQNIDEVKVLLDSYHIEWHYFIYSNKYGVFSTLFQLFKVIKLAIFIKKRNKIHIIHARSFIPAIMGYGIKYFDRKVKLLFDVRGFSTKEKIDRGRLKEGSILYTLLSYVENFMFKHADALNTLTYKAKEILDQKYSFQSDYIHVIPTCANSNHFKRLSINEKLNFKKSLGYADDTLIIIHTGTVSGWYDFDKELLFVKECMRQNEKVRFLILNQKEKHFIQKKLELFQIDRQKVKIRSVQFLQVPYYLNIADFSLFFIVPSESKQASAPTKFAENVACYLPSLTNNGVGDMDLYLRKYQVGWLIDLETLHEKLEEKVKNILKDVATKKFKDSAFEQLFYNSFNKRIAIEKYLMIYQQLLMEKR